jgi:hypothetical protein
MHIIVVAAKCACAMLCCLLYSTLAGKVAKFLYSGPSELLASQLRCCVFDEIYFLGRKVLRVHTNWFLHFLNFMLILHWTLYSEGLSGSIFNGRFSLMAYFLIESIKIYTSTPNIAVSQRKNLISY